MYTARTGLTLGFYGTDEDVVHSVLNGESDLKPTNNTYDWLANGIYFWDNSPSRVQEWALELSRQKRQKIKKPAVIGAILDLGYCLDLLDYKNLNLVKQGYTILQIASATSLETLPRNRGTEDLLTRELDCAVIEMLHQ